MCSHVLILHSGMYEQTVCYRLHLFFFLFFSAKVMFAKAFLPRDAESQLELLRFRCSSRGSEAAIRKRNAYGDMMGLGDKGAGLLIRAAQRLSLKNLDLAWNHLCDDALAVLEPASWPALTSLCLDWNSIGHKGAQALASALAKPNALRRLDLRSNPLGDAGVLAICRSLPHTLSWLGLGETMLTDEGAKEVSQSLVGHPSLTGLDLGENLLTDASCHALAGLISHTPFLRRFHLRGYLFEQRRVGDLGGEVLAQAVAGKEGFEIELDYQQVGCKTATALAACSPSWQKVGSCKCCQATEAP